MRIEIRFSGENGTKDGVMLELYSRYLSFPSLMTSLDMNDSRRYSSRDDLRCSVSERINLLVTVQYFVVQ